MSDTLYSIRIDDNDFREREMWAGDFEVIGPLLGDSATEEECEAVLERVIKHGNKKTRSGCTRFAEWFCATDYYDEILDVVNGAIDSYITDVAFELLASGRNEYGEPIVVLKDDGVTVTKVRQNDGWVHVIREHEDGTIEDMYE